MTKLLTIKDLVEYLNFSEKTIYKIVSSGELPSIKIGKEYRFKEEDVQNWLNAKTDKKIGGFEKLKTIDNPLKKRLYFLGLLTKELPGIQPILVGGNAVEFYTAGGYSTTGIDILAPSEPVDRVLTDWGFKKEGKNWVNADLDIQIEALTGQLEPRQLAMVTELTIENLKVFIIGIEDIIIDRMNAFVYWEVKDDKLWAKEMMANHLDEIDFDYLYECDEEVKKEMKKLEKEIRNAQI